MVLVGIIPKSIHITSNYNSIIFKLLKSQSCVYLQLTRKSNIANKFVNNVNCKKKPFKNSPNLKKNKKIFLNNSNYNNKKEQIHLIPHMFRTARSNLDTPYSFIVDDYIAESIAVKITKALEPQHEKFVVEVNPGLGLVTQHLLRKWKMNKLVIYDEIIMDPLKNTINQYKNVEIKKKNIFNLKGETGIAHEDFLSEMESFKDEEVIFFGVNPSRIFFRRLMQIMVLDNIEICKNLKFFFVLSEEVYQCLTSPTFHFSKSHDYGIFYILMDLKILGTYPRSAFLPSSLRRDKKMYLTQMARKKSISVLEPANLQIYFNFLKMIGSSKYNFVIGALEKWFPGSGPFFIANGVSVTMQTRDFSPVELIRLYKLFLKLDGYDSMIPLLQEWTMDLSGLE